ncbi:MAG TPA: hypothetical protein DD979_15230 [Gammaproteobacteria bacterium]|nr:hypothetical protein [Gammaproteobacteria bacterium]
MNSAVDPKSYETVGRCQTVAAILWPSFLVAGIANSMFWVMVDPHDFGLIAGISELSRIGAYSVGFLLSWAATALSSFVTIRFCKPCNQLNQKSAQ